MANSISKHKKLYLADLGLLDCCDVELLVGVCVVGLLIMICNANCLIKRNGYFDYIYLDIEFCVQYIANSGKLGEILEWYCFVFFLTKSLCFLVSVKENLVSLQHELIVFFQWMYPFSYSNEKFIEVSNSTKINLIFF